ncbi:hypothetical protein [uncultured Formosa sp.]|uniref:hypothetical protein n=1 Tax=uncultured Formosa sp. TaxID=255435 RepID=UPI00261DCC78|nr:hypothetical protein [uncultured Formosa sp.]
MKITQKRGSKKKEFELVNETELIIKETGFLSSKQWTIDIESIGHQKFIQTYSRNGLKIVGSCFVLIAIICLVTFFVEMNSNPELDVLIWGSLFFFLLGFTCFKAPLNNVLILNGGYASLTFYLDSPSREKVGKFVDKLIKLSKERIREKYSRIDLDLPEDTFMNQLNWLLNTKIITQVEYDQKKTDYKISKLIK